MSKEYTAFNCDAFWNDEYVQTLDPIERFIYMHYILNPRLENSGVYKITEGLVSFYTGQELEKVREVTKKLQKDGKVFRFGEWVAVPSSVKHQKFDRNQSVEKGIIDQLSKAPIELLQTLQECNYPFDISSLLPSSDDSAEQMSHPEDGVSTPPPHPEDGVPSYSNTYSNINSKSVCNADETPKKLFLNLWQQNPDVFNTTARIESPKDFNKFWEANQSITCEMVRLAVENFTADVRDGMIERRYIVSYPDRFVLHGWIQKCQERYKKKANNPQAGPPKNIAGKKSLGGLKDV